MPITKHPKPPNNNAKSIDRWDDEGGAPSGGDRSQQKRPRDPNQLGKLIGDISTGHVEDRAPTPEEQGKSRPPSL